MDPPPGEVLKVRKCSRIMTSFSGVLSLFLFSYELKVAFKAALQDLNLYLSDLYWWDRTVQLIRSAAFVAKS